MKESGNDDLKDLDIIIADTSNEASLEALVSNTKTVVTSVGKDGICLLLDMALWSAL